MRSSDDASCSRCSFRFRRHHRANRHAISSTAHWYPYSRLEKDELTDAEHKIIDNVGKKFLKKLDLIPFNQHWDYTVLDLEAKLKELARVGRKPDLTVVDYGDPFKHHEAGLEKRHEQTEVFRGLKKVAMMHSICDVDGKTKLVVRLRTLMKFTCCEQKTFQSVTKKSPYCRSPCTLNQTPREKKLGCFAPMSIFIGHRIPTTPSVICVIFERMIFYSRRLGHPARGDWPDWMDKRKKKKK